MLKVQGIKVYDVNAHSANAYGIEAQGVKVHDVKVYALNTQTPNRKIHSASKSALCLRISTQFVLLPFKQLFVKNFFYRLKKLTNVLCRFWGM